MLTNEWEDAKKGVWIQEDEVEKISDPAEQYLVDNFKMAYLKGKGRKYVPVLIPVDLIQAIDRISNDRRDFGIRKENPFLFATKNGFSHCSGWHAVAEVSERAEISIPVTATKIRHRLSSIYASLEMKPEDRKVILEYMGHEENINRENYQCPPAVRTARVMGKMLTTIDGVEHTCNGNTENDENGQGDYEGSSSCSNQRNKSGSVQESLNGIQCSAMLPEETCYVNEEDTNGDDEQVESVQKNVPRTSRKCSVKWSREDSIIVRNHFRDFVYQTAICSTNERPLQSKEAILQFLATTNLQSIRGLTAHEQYTKVRTKLFNDRL
ncbi:uncharacterized protein LOC125674959 [Ostrea edulis]|uniref:uncharacterized protein LOC125674959 n=2 Tax=Ostrea edulis TaxID=37623 RepID=UPI0020961943|nr:uncharacterized protein LOC125674959 [Ostrea edulis]XP_056015186.1 uncharacterized protein LOC125674959 [Ostrea edulis]